MSKPTRRPRATRALRRTGTTRHAEPSSPLALWLTAVIVGLSDRIFGRSDWAETLGVSPQAVGQWLNGQGTPSPDNLDEIVTVLEESYPTVAEAELAAFAELAARPLAEVAPRTKHAASTLDHYRTAARFRLFEEALAPLQPCAQREILDESTARCNERVLSRRPHAVGAPPRRRVVPPTPVAWSAGAHHEIVVHYGAEEVVDVQRQRSLFASPLRA